jgi:hypothetical protein
MSASTSEIVQMVQVAGVNRLVFYATFLGSHFEHARKDLKVLKVLQGCRQILHTGVPLDKENEEWAYNNGIPITVG